MNGRGIELSEQLAPRVSASLVGAGMIPKLTLTPSIPLCAGLDSHARGGQVVPLWPVIT